MLVFRQKNINMWQFVFVFSNPQGESLMISGYWICARELELISDLPLTSAWLEKRQLPGGLKDRMQAKSPTSHALSIILGFATGFIFH